MFYFQLGILNIKKRNQPEMLYFISVIFPFLQQNCELVRGPFGIVWALSNFFIGANS